MHPEPPKAATGATALRKRSAETVTPYLSILGKGGGIDLGGSKRFEEN